MPRKYHRPPTTKRRKRKKSATPNVYEPLPEESQTDHSTAAIGDADSEDAPAEAPVARQEQAAQERATPSDFGARKARPARHLVTDYTYVVDEIKLSLGLATFLIIALVITAILR